MCGFVSALPIHYQVNSIQHGKKFRVFILFRFILLVLAIQNENQHPTYLSKDAKSWPDSSIFMWCLYFHILIALQHHRGAWRIYRNNIHFQNVFISNTQKKAIISTYFLKRICFQWKSLLFQTKQTHIECQLFHYPLILTWNKWMCREKKHLIHKSNWVISFYNIVIRFIVYHPLKKTLFWEKKILPGKKVLPDQ